MGATAAARDEHLDAIRALMAAHSPPLHALLVPSEDAHQSEYVSERDKRREFISGFSGSAGLALITMKEALLWTDGRYFLQATQELSDRWKLMRIGEDPPVEIWIADNMSDEAIIGINPWCISVDTAQRYEQAFSKEHQMLFHLSSDLVDEIWKDRPPVKALPVVVHPVEFAGRSVSEKIKELREKLLHEKAYGIITTALDEVAWLYNIRGDDVNYSPVVHSYAIVTLHSAFFYVDKQKVSVEVQNYMAENGIDIREYSIVQSDVSLLASGKLNGSAVDGSSHDGMQNSKIWIDSNSCCLSLYSKLSVHQVLMLQSPIALPKAVKNPIELDGLRKAHIRDGAAVVQYLAWLDNQMQQNYGASGYFSEAKGSQKKEHLETKLTEVSVSDKLEGFRATKEHFKGLSFPTISSVGPNAAIIHYSPEANTCSELDADKIYLCDSGAQYLDGTTDITRTVHFGKPSEHEKSCYTAVLKGHIALDSAAFPNGTTGHALDILARTPLWKDGLDYRHGTGHGIGSYLNVHEGPHLISFRPSARNVPLQASMTVTDEPGYYEDGNFGIRLENVLIVKEASTKFNFGEKGYLAFEHITWAPYQMKLIDIKLLTPAEMEWVNTYHSACRKILEPHLNEQEKEWLRKATEPIAVIS
ncbi:aminopeptidase P1-like [Phragmites australis]|uniref:aminopeptidase P1-like n=1 Tax=Phragmites australis TaxID=29695 RepID=UPI002D7831AA|nr:aminopeptidase P1-like [Phragmites australis]